MTKGIWRLHAPTGKCGRLADGHEGLRFQGTVPNPLSLPPSLPPSLRSAYPFQLGRFQHRAVPREHGQLYVGEGILPPCHQLASKDLCGPAGRGGGRGPREGPRGKGQARQGGGRKRDTWQGNWAAGYLSNTQVKALSPGTSKRSSLSACSTHRAERAGKVGKGR